MRLISLICVLGTLGYVKADCYPGNTAFTNIVQEIYKGVTSDNIILKYLGTSAINRQNLCQILVTHHNHGKNSGQFETNRQFLGNLHIWKHICVNALTYTTGYNSLTGWQNWAGYHSGKWYAETKIFSDGAMWYTPYSKYESGQMYAVQPVRFDSKWRKDNCHTKDSTGATCRNGWNQSGSGIQYVWGWDPKDNSCPSPSSRGRRGTHVGFPFSVSTASCIVWVTTEEAFLECVRNGRRTSTSSGPSVGYGQWTVD